MHNYYYDVANEMHNGEQLYVTFNGLMPPNFYVDALTAHFELSDLLVRQLYIIPRYGSQFKFFFAE